MKVTNKTQLSLNQATKVNTLIRLGWKVKFIGFYLAYLTLGDRKACVNRDGHIMYEDEDGR